jgi:hypothetical protein
VVVASLDEPLPPEAFRLAGIGIPDGIMIIELCKE